MSRAVVGSLLAIFCSACTARAEAPGKVAFYVFRLDPPALVELSSSNQVLHEIPISIPAGCNLDQLHPAPRGPYLAMELECSFGRTAVWLNTETGEPKQAVTDSDSHFLAWTPDGRGMYLRVDSINRPHIIRAYIDGKQDSVSITELTYDLAPAPPSNPFSDGSDFIFSFSRGMGLGSEMYFAQFDGRIVRQVMADPDNYLSFASWSPNGKKITFIKIPDSPTPFTVGELWVMDANGSNARKLAAADAGHGFPPAWSPDGSRIAFVVRENQDDVQADQFAEALVSNIHIISVITGKETSFTKFQGARVEAPFWSPDGNKIAFTVVMNDKMKVYLGDADSDQVQQVLADSTCCPAWMRK